jgi:hypothetical protein
MLVTSYKTTWASTKKTTIDMVEMEAYYGAKGEM